MGVQIYRDIIVDFSNARYIILNAKQFDSKSRYIRVTCTNLGQKVDLNANIHSAFIRYQKPDGYGVFNRCAISDHGEILFELTEQMLATVGTSYADLVILDVAKSDINNDLTIISPDGHIVENNSSIVSTMTFYINVLDKPIDYEEIESSNEYSALNELLLKATKEYDYIVQTTKEYMDNAKVSETNAAQSAANANTSETNTSISEANAAISETNAAASAENAKNSESNAANSANNASTSASLANTKASEASDNAKKAEMAAQTATQKATEAATSADTAIQSASNAKASELNAAQLEEITATYADTASQMADSAKKSLETMQDVQVTGVKGNIETTYRKGDVNLTPANLGAVNKAGDTMTGNLSAPTFTTNTAMTLASGKVSGLTAGTAKMFSNGIAISNPATANDQGWMRVTGTGESDTVLEIATGDDGGSGEEIVARQYNTSNAVAREVKLLDKNGNTSFPGTVTAPTFSGALSGNAATASKLGTASVGGTAKPIYLNAGTPTAISSTVGGTAKPVYLNAGTLTAISSTVGNATKPVYLNSGTATACTYSLEKSVPSDAVFTDTTYSNMTGATTSTAGKAGLVPAPAAGAATRYLRSDGTWQVPPDNNTTYGAATTIAAGLMSAADKIKLNGITSGANTVTHTANVSAGSGGATGTVNVNAGAIIFTYGRSANSSTVYGCNIYYVPKSGVIMGIIVTSNIMISASISGLTVTIHFGNAGGTYTVLG